jgi:hypothetical protein
MVNVFMSLSFLMYLAVFRPFIDQQTFRINLINEFCMYAVSLIYLTFTDFNPDAYAKVVMGWLVILLVISNLIFPNGYMMVRNSWPDIKGALCKQDEVKKIYTNRKLDKSRFHLVRKNKSRIMLKPEF